MGRVFIQHQDYSSITVRSGVAKPASCAYTHGKLCSTKRKCTLKSVLRLFLTLAITFILLFITVPVRAKSNASAVFNSIQFVANLETIGVAVSGTGLPATAELFYRQSGETEWRRGHPLMRIKDGRLI